MLTQTIFTGVGTGITLSVIAGPIFSSLVKASIERGFKTYIKYGKNRKHGKYKVNIAFLHQHHGYSCRIRNFKSMDIKPNETQNYQANHCVDEPNCRNSNAYLLLKNDF